jgi:hypothetical protein
MTETVFKIGGKEYPVSKFELDIDKGQDEDTIGQVFSDFPQRLVSIEFSANVKVAADAFEMLSWTVLMDKRRHPKSLYHLRGKKGSYLIRKARRAGWL